MGVFSNHLKKKSLISSRNTQTGAGPVGPMATSLPAQQQSKGKSNRSTDAPRPTFPAVGSWASSSSSDLSQKGSLWGISKGGRVPRVVTRSAHAHVCNLSQTWDHRLAPTLQPFISKWPVIHLRNWPAVYVQCGPCIDKPRRSLQPSDPLWLPWGCSKTPRGVHQAHPRVVPAP